MPIYFLPWEPVNEDLETIKSPGLEVDSSFKLSRPYVLAAAFLIVRTFARITPDLFPS